MALKKTVLTVFGFEAKDAYHRVEGVRLAAKDKIQFQVRASIDATLPHFSDKMYECDYKINGSNPINQAYEYIKTIDEFADAVDC
jgi:hypothetical protein